jgi:hypothetical protein
MFKIEFKDTPKGKILAGAKRFSRFLFTICWNRFKMAKCPHVIFRPREWPCSHDFSGLALCSAVTLYVRVIDAGALASVGDVSCPAGTFPRQKRQFYCRK